MERPMELSFRKFRNGDTCPGATLVPLLMVRAGTVMKLVPFRALNMSTRYSKLLRSLILNDLAMDRSTLLKPGAMMVFLPTMRALGAPIPSMKCTVFGSTHAPFASGLEKPVEQVVLIVARVLSGADRLLMSGRSGPDWPSQLRSEPFAIVKGSPVCQSAIPASFHPPKTWRIRPVLGARISHENPIDPTWRRSKSELP